MSVEDPLEIPPGVKKLAEEIVKGFGNLPPELKEQYQRELSLTRSVEEGKKLWRRYELLGMSQLLYEENQDLRARLKEMTIRCQELEKCLGERESRDLQAIGSQRLNPQERPITPLGPEDSPPIVETFKRERPEPVKETASSSPKESLSWWKKLALRSGAVLALVPFLAGSGGPVSSPSVKEGKRLSPDGQELRLPTLPASPLKVASWEENLPVPTPEPTPLPAEAVKEPVPLPVLPAPPVEKTVAPEAVSSTIEVTIPPRGWFWQAAKLPVENWLLGNGLSNWENKENGVRLSDVIIKILVEDLRGGGVNFQGLRAGQKFTFNLGGNGKVVKAAQTQTYREYAQGLAGLK